MNTGMLWFDNDPKTSLSAKIERAVEYYKKKYGRRPNLCLIHPRAVESSTASSKSDGSAQTGIVVRPYRPVLPGHLWIGIDPAISSKRGTGEKN